MKKHSTIKIFSQGNGSAKLPCLLRDKHSAIEKTKNIRVKLKTIVVVLCVCLLSACMDIQEEIVINENGTGTYSSRTDMGALLQLVATMAGEEEIQKNGLNRAIDTLIQMKDVVAGTEGLTPEHKRLISEGSMKLKMNMEESLLKADISFPFTSYGDLQTLMDGSATGSIGDIFKQVFAQDGNPASGDSQIMDKINTVFDVTVSKNEISKKLNRAKFDSLMLNPELAEMKQMMGSVATVDFTTTVHLPRKVKKVDNELITLSADKKTATLKYNLSKLFTNPEQFSYTIQY